MQLSSIEDAFAALESQLESVDIDTLGGADACSLVDVITPHKRRLDAFVLLVVSRAVEANQHNLDGARSGPCWVASKTGISEKQARSDLGLQKHLSELPDVESAVRSGEISLAHASVISRGAGGDQVIARSLLQTARNATVEMLGRRAQELRAIHQGL